MNTVLAASDGYVVKFAEPAFWSIGIHAISIIIFIASLIIGIYLLVLVIRFLRLGIRYYKSQLEDQNREEGK